MSTHKLSSMILVGAVVCYAVVAQAAPVTIATVPVGNPGNAADTVIPNPGYGKVDYNYRIGTYEVTNTEYTAFLNAVDAGGTNPNGIYNTSMGSDVRGGITNTGPTGSKYAVKAGMGYMPVTYVSFWDACRFANWLHNGQGAVSTENGAYTLTTDGITNNTITRNVHWKWAVASENEWYKGAYHQPVTQGGDADNYWLYPTATNVEPYSDQPPGSGAPDQTNTANFYKTNETADGYDDGYAVTGSTSYVPPQNYLTNVGAYTQSDSFYGTFDQGGNVWEWNEAIIVGSSRGLRGGNWNIGSYYLAASYRSNGTPTNEVSLIGFRVASVPEPGSLILIVSGAIVALILWRRRK